MSRHAHRPHTAAQAHRDEITRRKRAREFFGTEHPARHDSELLSEAGEIVAETVRVRGLRAVEEM